MLLLGLPIHGVLCARNKRRWFYYAVSGAAAGILAVLVFIIVLEGSMSEIPVALIGLGAAAGATAALLFHLIRGPHLALTEPSNTTTSPS